MDKITLNNGVKMPLLGFGTFQMTDQEICKASVAEALKIGYRMIDTAACYENEKAVGEAVIESGISRKDLFLVSKVWIQDAGYEKTMASFKKTLMQSNIIAIPKSVHKERICQNFDISDFALSLSDMERVERMDTGKSLILDVPALNEVKRLHTIRFVQ